MSHINALCVPHGNESRLTQICHVPHMNESCPTYEISEVPHRNVCDFFDEIQSVCDIVSCLTQCKVLEM